MLILYYGVIFLKSVIIFIYFSFRFIVTPTFFLRVILEILNNDIKLI